MTCKKLMTKKLLVGPVLGAILSAVIVAGCTGDAGHGDGRDSDRATVSQGVPERESGDSGGEHGGRREGTESREEGGEGSGEHGSGGDGEEGSANMLAPDETFDAVRGGARLILKYDGPSNSFKGTVENTTSGVLDRVRVEVHLSNGTELGPTTPTDMAPGEVAAINLPATPGPFTGWTAHAEVGGGGEGSESGGEHGSGRESGGEHGSGDERRGGG